MLKAVRLTANIDQVQQNLDVLIHQVTRAQTKIALDQVVFDDESQKNVAYAKTQLLISVLGDLKENLGIDVELLLVRNLLKVRDYATLTEEERRSVYLKAKRELARVKIENIIAKAQDKTGGKVVTNTIQSPGVSSPSMSLDASAIMDLREIAQAGRGRSSMIILLGPPEQGSSVTRGTLVELPAIA